MKCLVAIIGPTAIGKSELALYLSQKFDGVIVNADSRQVYRYMDIGTAKPSHIEQLLIPHRLIDIVDPDEHFSLAIYQELADGVIKDVQHHNKLPVLVGGSGLYVWSVLEGWEIPKVPPDLEFRYSLETKAREEGSYALYEKLLRVDPVAAMRIMPTNLRRVIRALEVYQATGMPVSQPGRRHNLSFPVLVIGLTTERADLYQIIDSRVDEMIKHGFVDEVEGLVANGYSLELASMSGIGYRQMGMFLKGDLDLPTAIQQIKTGTHRFARKQYAWFRLNDDRVHWLDVNEGMQENANKLVEAFLAELEDEEVDNVFR